MNTEPMSERAKRWLVLGPGVLLGGLFAAVFYLLELPSASSPLDRFLTWLEILSGPVYGTWLGLAMFHWLVLIGWCGLPLTMAHPIRPNAATAFLSLIGLVLWFGSGWVTIVVCVWGA
jgi:hypothetical protein